MNGARNTFTKPHVIASHFQHSISDLQQIGFIVPLRGCSHLCVLVEDLGCPELGAGSFPWVKLQTCVVSVDGWILLGLLSPPSCSRTMYSEMGFEGIHCCFLGSRRTSVLAAEACFQTRSWHISILPSVSVLEHLFLKLVQMMPLSASQVQRYEHQASELHCFLRSTFVRQGTGSREKGLPAELSPPHLRRHPSQRAA